MQTPRFLTKNAFSLGVAMLGISQLADAQAITYLMYDNTCVRKHDYQLVKGSGTDFYDFYVQHPTQPTQRLILRTPKMEGNLYVAQTKNLEPNATVWQCGDVDNLTDEVSDAVNRQLRALYVAEKTTTGYTLYQIQEIGAYNETDKSISYNDLRFRFAYRYDTTYAAGANLAQTPNKVLFNDIQRQNCVYNRSFKGFVNTQLPQTIHFLEGIGVYKYIQSNTEIQLKSINGTPTDAYLSNYCNSKKLTPATVKTTTTTADNKPATGATSPESLGASSSLFGGSKPTNTQDKTIVNPKLATDNFVARGTTTPPIKSAVIDTFDAPAGYHRVREGDNLYKLSMRYNVTIEELMYWNNMPDDKLKLMQMLKVQDDGSNPYKDSNPKIVDDVANGVRYRVHVVHQHERLFNIATRYNLSIVDLYKLNNLQSDALQVKQELIVGKETL